MNQKEPISTRERQERLRSFLNSKKRYSDFLDELLHDARHIDSEVIEILTGNVRSVDGVVARMKALGVKGQAYLVGDCGPFSDGHVADIDTLLTACVGSMCDCMVYSRVSNVAYYEGHQGFG